MLMPYLYLAGARASTLVKTYNDRRVTHKFKAFLIRKYGVGRSP